MKTLAELNSELKGALRVKDAISNEMLRRRCTSAEDYINNIFDDLFQARRELAAGDKTTKQLANKVQNLEKAADKIWKEIALYVNKLSE